MSLTNKWKTTLAGAMLLALTGGAQAELRVPAFTAYAGTSRSTVLWFGELKHPGQLDCSLALQLPSGTEKKYRLTVAGQSHEAVAKGQGEQTVSLHFEPFTIATPGYQSFALETPDRSREVEALVLDGPAAQDAHFNLKERRNATSVHLSYPNLGFTNVDAFYCEVTAVETPLWTYFEACGWHRGYFGMQVNSPTERRIIFSVWDSGNEAASRDKVRQEDRVTLLAKGENVFSGDFGNEGTGGHSHFVYDWKTGETQRFIVIAKPTDATHTIYSGYWFRPEQKKWMLISSWKAPKDGEYLHGLYSFVENFGGDNGQLNRKALYGNQWLRTADGQWHEVATASFSHDPTGKDDRLDRFMGVENGQFFLSTGGFVPGFTEYGEKFTRPSTGQAPSDIVLPETGFNSIQAPKRQP